MQLKCHVTHSELIEGVAKTSGNPYKMVRIQGVLEIGEDRQIFRTVLPSGSDVPEPGMYMADFEPRVNNQTMELGGGITKLTRSAPAPKAGATA